MDQTTELTSISSSTENATVLALQSAIQSIVTEGTRYAVELKASDKLIDRNADLLKQEPSNPTLKTDQARKIAARDLCLRQIKDLSSRISNQLYETFIQNFPQSSLKQEPTDPVSDNQPLDPQESLSSVQDRFEFLENQISTNHQQHLKEHQHQQQVIEILQQQINIQSDQISNLKQIILGATPLVSNGHLDKNNNDNDNNKNNETGIEQTSAHLELEEIRQDIREMSMHFDQLQLKVITILTKEIPVNLQRSVRLIQQDVDSATRNALESGHKQITELLRDLVSEYETRLTALERLASRTTSTTITDPSDSSKPNATMSNPPTNPSAPPALTSKDPRILRRQSGLKSLPPELKSTPTNETDCAQQ